MSTSNNQVSRRKKDSARLVWDTKPRRAPNPRDIEFQTAEIVVPNPERDLKQLPMGFTGEPLVIERASQMVLGGASVAPTFRSARLEHEQNANEARGKNVQDADLKVGATGWVSDPGAQRSLRVEDIDKTKMNRLIWGDNLLAMQALLAQGYEGKVQL